MQNEMNCRFAIQFFSSLLCKLWWADTCSNTQAWHSLPACAPDSLLPGKTPAECRSFSLKNNHPVSIKRLELLKQDQEVIKMLKKKPSPCLASAQQQWPLVLCKISFCLASALPENLEFCLCLCHPCVPWLIHMRAIHWSWKTDSD